MAKVHTIIRTTIAQYYVNQAVKGGVERPQVHPGSVTFIQRFGVLSISMCTITLFSLRESISIAPRRASRRALSRSSRPAMRTLPGPPEDQSAGYPHTTSIGIPGDGHRRRGHRL